jgi:hypothetical protein
MGTAMMAVLLVASPSAAAPIQPMATCTHGYEANYAWAVCDRSRYVGGFDLGVKCLLPGNQYYWYWGFWAAGPRERRIYCDGGAVARGSRLVTSL